MRILRAWVVRVAGTFSRRKREQELSAEMESHLDLHIEDNLRAGMTPQEARRQALVKLGGMEQAKEQYRERRGIPVLETLIEDVRFGMRLLRKSPGFTAIAILTLALGIGANTAIFSAVDAVLLAPLPYANPGQLVFLPDSEPKAGVPGEGMSYPTFAELRDNNSIFTAMAGLTRHALTLTGHGEPAEISTVGVTQDFFSVFPVKPLLGRTLLPEDGVRGAAPVVLLSENLWRSDFGADPKIVGSSTLLDKRAFTVVGVMPASFHTPFVGEADPVWIPVVQDPLFGKFLAQRGGHFLPVIARLRPDVSLARAQAEMKTLTAGLARAFPEDKDWVVSVEPLKQEIVGGVESPLLILSCAVGLVLLIACVNLANLLLTRATSRSKEMAVRMALGAGKQRLTRQLLTESATLGILGGVAGIFSAYGGVSALVSFLPSGLPQLHSIRVNASVLAFALILSLAASLIFGLAPVLFARGADPQKDLRESARSGEGKNSQRARNLLAASEIALALVLLVGAGLLLRSFAQLNSVSPGFDARHVVKANIALPQYQYAKPQQWNTFAKELMTRLAAEPGMKDSAIVVPAPIVDGFINLGFDIVGNPPLPPGANQTADFVTTTPQYFQVMHIPLVRGRLFNAEDTAASRPVALISEALAKRYFPHQDPVGREMRFGFPPNSTNSNTAREIVGVVGDVRDQSLSQVPGPMMYAPYAQQPIWGGDVVVRSTLSASAVAAAIRSATHNIDKDLPVTEMETLPEGLYESVAQARFRTLILGLFGGMALVLAAVGIFGVVSYSVSRRTHEIGIRMALGATPASVRRLVIGASVRLVLIGLVVGIPAALVLTRFLSTLLFAVSPSDPPTFAAVAIVLAAVTLAAAYIPARRAMKVDPMVALRYE